MSASPPAAVTGTYSDIKLVKTRSVAVIMVEIPIETAGAFVAAFGMPIPGQEVHVAIARLNGSPKPEPAPAASAGRPATDKMEWRQVPDKRAWSDLGSAQQAGMRCAEPRFWKFLEEREGIPDPIKNAEDCALALRFILGITSRKDIAGDPAVFNAWQALDAEYNSWCFEQGREVR